VNRRSLRNGVAKELVLELETVVMIVKSSNFTSREYRLG
jgi:hypothetical protein